MTLTHDAFLGGKLYLWQPACGYRAGVDPVFLAASVPAKSGQSVLELGCGVGTAMLCLGARVPGLTLTGVEVQADYAALAQRNALEASQDARIAVADLRALPENLRQRRFDHVIMNPPYLDGTAGAASDDKGRDLAFRGDTPLSDWLDVAMRRLAPKGHLTLIQHIARLPEVMQAIDTRVGGLVVQPLAAREGRAPDRFLLQGRHGGRGAFCLRPIINLHSDAVHKNDQPDYTPLTASILRHGANLSISR